MKKINEFSLVDGQFTISEAHEVLNSLFRDKIRFHDLKNFSSIERTGSKDQHSVERLEQLQESLSKIAEMIEMHKNEEGEFVIESNVKVSFLAYA